MTIKLGDTEEWTILNQDSQYHDFHIHQTGFLVTEVNGIPTRFGGLRDTGGCQLSPAIWDPPGLERRDALSCNCFAFRDLVLTNRNNMVNQRGCFSISAAVVA